MCVPQPSPARGRRAGTLSCLWFLNHLRLINQEMVLHHCSLLGSSRENETPLFPRSPEGPTCQGIPRSRSCSQTRSTFKALILNESCFVGQIPQACAGPDSTRCALGGQTAPLHHPCSEETKRKHGAVKTRLSFSKSLLALLSRPAQRGAGCQAQCNAFPPLFTKRNSFFFFFCLWASLFSHPLFSLKG